MKREDVLMEALPYIQQFHGKTIVIKLGGHARGDVLAGGGGGKQQVAVVWCQGNNLGG